jgi:hypothetical protein
VVESVDVLKKVLQALNAKIHERKVGASQDLPWHPFFNQPNPVFL